MPTQTQIMDAMEGRGWMRAIDIRNALGCGESGMSAVLRALLGKGAIETRGAWTTREWKFVERVEVIDSRNGTPQRRKAEMGWPRQDNLPEDEITTLYDDQTYDPIGCLHDPEGPCWQCEKLMALTLYDSKKDAHACFESYYAYKRGQLED